MISSPPGIQTMPFMEVGEEKATSARPWLVFSEALEAQETIPISPINPIKWRKRIIEVSYTD
jgi:hypothetical protein